MIILVNNIKEVFETRIHTVTLNAYSVFMDVKYAVATACSIFKYYAFPQKMRQF